MIRRLSLPLLLLVVTACTAPEVAWRQVAPPNTVDDVLYAPAPKAVEPWSPWDKRPPIRLNVAVNADGSVGDAQVIGGYLATSVYELALTTVRSWRFEPGPPRRRFVTFVFEEDPIDGPTHIEARLKPPLTLRVVNHYDSVARWPRIGGRVEEKTCQVHGERMTIELVPMEYSGLPPLPPSPLRQAYILASSAFPNGYDRAGGGCVPGPHTRAEIYVCASCRKARAAWIAAHGGTEPME